MSTATSALAPLQLMPWPPRYDIEADWTLMTTCNFRCVYCFFDDRALGRKIRIPASPPYLSAFFNRTELTWMLHLTGGEPFYYPNFVELCRLLTRKHLISVNSNADSPKVLEFARTIDPDRVDFINCAVHLQQRTERKRVSQFVRHVQALRTSGFDAYVSSVMYPEVFPLFLEQWDWFAEQGLPLFPKAFRGDYEGRRYPEAYTEGERLLFLEYSIRAGEAYREQFSLRSERPTIDPHLDRTHMLHGVRDYRGSMCQAGDRFVTINGKGEIRRCVGGNPIGHIVEGWFERRTGPTRCDVTFCPYYCEKYSSIGEIQHGLMA